MEVSQLVLTNAEMGSTSFHFAQHDRGLLMFSVYFTCVSCGAGVLYSGSVAFSARYTEMGYSLYIVLLNNKTLFKHFLNKIIFSKK